MLEEQIFAEIKQIPPEKLTELYDLIHSFRLDLLNKKPQLSFSQRWQGQFKLTDQARDERFDYLKQRYQL